LIGVVGNFNYKKCDELFLKADPSKIILLNLGPSICTKKLLAHVSIPK